MDALKSLNIGIRFLLEIVVLVSVGYWGFKTGSGGFLKFLLGIGAPLLIAVVWGSFGAPKAPYHLSGLALLFLEIAVFGSGVAALYATKNYPLAWTLAAVMIINRILMFAWKQ